MAPDFRILFEHAPAPFLVLSPDPEYRIVAVSNAYLAATMTERSKILGQRLFDVFPDNPDDPAATGTRALGASLLRVRETARSDTMAVQRYDIRAPDGGFEVRWWSPVNCAVTDERGRLRYIVHRVEDVTEYVAARAGAEQEILQRSRELDTARSSLTDLVGRLSAPVIETWDGIRTVPLIGPLDGARWAAIGRAVRAEVERARVRVVILELGSVGTVDRAVLGDILDLHRTVRLMGCALLLSAVRVDTAIALSQIDNGLLVPDSFPTQARALEAALRICGLSIVPRGAVP